LKELVLETDNDTREVTFKDLLAFIISG